MRRRGRRRGGGRRKRIWRSIEVKEEEHALEVRNRGAIVGEEGGK